MKVADIIRIADGAYGDGWEVKKAYKTGKNPGDTLAAFIASELSECLGDEAKVNDYTQLNEALRLMENARDDLCNVCEAFEEELNKLAQDEDWRRRNPGVDPTDPRI